MNLSYSNKVGRPLSIAPTERSVGKEYRENCFYVHVARCLLSLVYEVAQLSDRSVAIRALDIICQLSLLADNAVVFQHAPPLFFQLLVDMLNCSITASDPFRNHHYLQGMEKISTLLRPPPAALSTSFHAHLCDGEVRDVALETIQALCSNSKALRAMFGRVPGIFSTLCNIVQACLAASRAGFNVNSLTVGMVYRLVWVCMCKCV